MNARLKHLRRLVTLLEEERAALHDTDLARLDRLTPRKVQLLDRLAAENEAPASDDEARELRTVQSLARRNAGLIEAALAGLRDVQALLDRAREPAAHATYGRDGTRQDMGAHAGRLDGRA
jgi:flagellar biosynthesis/type III secretory pathway chaperone